MSIVQKGSQQYTMITVLDSPGQGGACHEYEVSPSNAKSGERSTFAKISFQNGPIKEFGVNGIHQEDLLNIVLDRLESFQKGDFRCRENAIAITKIEEAIMWLGERTRHRQQQGVEGLSKPHKSDGTII